MGFSPRAPSMKQCPNAISHTEWPGCHSRSTHLQPAAILIRASVTSPESRCRQIQCRTNRPTHTVPYVVCLSVTLVHPTLCATQPVKIFGNFSSPSGTLAIHWHSLKILRRSSQGNPYVGGLNHLLPDRKNIILTVVSQCMGNDQYCRQHILYHMPRL